MKNQIAKSFVMLLALALGIACTQSASAQQFKLVKVKGGATLVQIAAGGASAWARASNGNPYIFNGKQFVLANSISLTQLAVGGGNALQPDAVWGLDSSGGIYQATKSGASWVFSPVPGNLDFLAVGIGFNRDFCHPYEVWGLNSDAPIFRYNFCNQNWDNVPGTLATLAVGGGDIWGINGNGQLFMFDFATLLFECPSWAYPYTFVQVTAGPDGAYVLWPNYAVAQIAPEVGALGGRLTQIQAGGNGLWGIDSSQHIFQFDATAVYFYQIPGKLVSISVGSVGVWGLDSSGKAYGFVTP
jgi:hypothetical protein